MVDEAAAERRINNERLYQMVDDIHRAVFLGNGRPGLNTRVSVLEHQVCIAKKQTAAQWGGVLGIALAVVLERLGVRVQ